MMLGSKEQRTEGMRRQAQELIDQAYERGFKAGKESEVIAIQESQYQRGLDDAWETARKICVPTFNGGLSCNDVYSIFRTSSFDTISHNYTASEAIAKIKAYEEQKNAEEEFKIGDELIDVDSKDKCVIVGFRQEKIKIVWSDGSVGLWDKKNFRKTGRSFPQISEVLEKMKEGE